MNSSFRIIIVKIIKVNTIKVYNMNAHVITKNMTLSESSLTFSRPCGIMGYVQSRGLGALPPRLPSFILLARFSDTLLVVSILDSLWLPFEATFAVMKGLKKDYIIITEYNIVNFFKCFICNKSIRNKF